MSKLTNQDIVRAWKDADFRNQLSGEQRAALPENPAGVVELSIAELNEVAGGQGQPITGPPCWIIESTHTKNTWPCCATVDITCESKRTVGGKLVVGS